MLITHTITKLLHHTRKTSAALFLVLLVGTTAHAQVAYKSSGSTASGYDNINVAVPSGIAANDTLVVQLEMTSTDDGATLGNIGCGFTCTGPTNSNTSSGQNLDYICYKNATGTESGTCQFGRNGTVDSYWLGTMSDWSGGAATQFDASIGNNSNTAGTTLTAPSVTPSVCSGDMLLGGFEAFVNGNSITNAPASGFTEAYSVHDNGYMELEYQSLSSCSATGTIVVNASSNTHWSADGILIKASVAATPTPTNTPTPTPTPAFTATPTSTPTATRTPTPTATPTPAPSGSGDVIIFD
jgi:hypothetical protein